jgi:hypothetical protein
MAPNVTTKIMIIRHGEKPGVPVAADGIDEDGNVDTKSLTAAGWQRAHALVDIFNPPATIAIRAGLGVPDHLFAASTGSGDQSKRPIETITPLSESFDPALAIDDTIDSTDIKSIAKAARKIGGVALACWRHENILAIAQRLAPAAALPKKWPGGRFDMIWVFDLNPAGDYEFTQVPELALPTDDATPMR